MTHFDEIVSAFGAATKAKLAGPGDREAAIRAPLEALVTDVAADLGLTAVPYDEVRDTERAVRPDYAIGVGGAITGYIEVKKPGASIDPDAFTGHNLRQWQRQRDLPNLIYTNGTEWRLWRDGEEVVVPVHLSAGRWSGPERDSQPRPRLRSCSLTSSAGDLRRSHQCTHSCGPSLP